MEQTNMLLLMDDEHSKRVLGCYGNPLAKTPHLDRIAENGVTFTNAYTPCPLCVPARGSLQTGRYVHKIGCWSNAEPYHGQIPGWGHRLRRQGHKVVSIGKLHFRSNRDDNGFSEEIMPVHVVEGKGDLHGCIRKPKLYPRPGFRLLALKAGYGDSYYTNYDADVCARAVTWLQKEAPKHRDKPWVLFVSFYRPHFPLIAPKCCFDLYPLHQIPLPFQTGPHEVPQHPVLKAIRAHQDYADHFTGEENVRTALAAYYGMVTSVDKHVGRLLDVLEQCRLAESTRIVYASDHGDNLGNRGLWGKANMYEDSADIPLLMSGPDIPKGASVDTLVSLVDIYQTIVEGTGEALTDFEKEELPGHSLIRIAHGERRERTVFSEYHALSAITGIFMIRFDRWKYVHYEGYPPQLFDLVADPLEAHDLGRDSRYAEVVALGEAKLREIVDPSAATEQAFRDQEALIEKNGGLQAVLARGSLPYTPVPADQIQLVKGDS